MVDLHEKYENNGERIDVFYGKDRVYVTLRKSEETRKKFANFIQKTKKWIKVKKVWKIPLHFRKVQSGTN